jgi:hypothetical protein
MNEKVIGAILDKMQDPTCCPFAVMLQHQKLIKGLEHARKSYAVGSFASSFHRHKAIEVLSDVAMQTVYPRGKKCALLVLKVIAT